MLFHQYHTYTNWLVIEQNLLDSNEINVYLPLIASWRPILKRLQLQTWKLKNIIQHFTQPELMFFARSQTKNETGNMILSTMFWLQFHADVTHCEQTYSQHHNQHTSYYDADCNCHNIHIRPDTNNYGDIVSKGSPIAVIIYSAQIILTKIISIWCQITCVMALYL